MIKWELKPKISVKTIPKVDMVIIKIELCYKYWQIMQQVFKTILITYYIKNVIYLSLFFEKIYDLYKWKKLCQIYSMNSQSVHEFFLLYQSEKILFKSKKLEFF